ENNADFLADPKNSFLSEVLQGSQEYGWLPPTTIPTAGWREALNGAVQHVLLGEADPAQPMEAGAQCLDHGWVDSSPGSSVDSTGTGAPAGLDEPGLRRAGHARAAGLAHPAGRVRHLLQPAQPAVRASGRVRRAGELPASVLRPG